MAQVKTNFTITVTHAIEVSTATGARRCRRRRSRSGGYKRIELTRLAVETYWSEPGWALKRQRVTVIGCRLTEGAVVEGRGAVYEGLDVVVGVVEVANGLVRVADGLVQLLLHLV